MRIPNTWDFLQFLFLKLEEFEALSGSFTGPQLHFQLFMSKKVTGVKIEKRFSAAARSFPAAPATQKGPALRVICLIRLEKGKRTLDGDVVE